MKIRTLPPYKPERIELRDVPGGTICSPVSYPCSFLLRIHDGKSRAQATATAVWLVGGPGIIDGEAQEFPADMPVVVPEKMAVTQ